MSKGAAGCALDIASAYNKRERDVLLSNGSRRLMPDEYPVVEVENEEQDGSGQQSAAIG
jgi:hypothetical protein